MADIPLAFPQIGNALSQGAHAGYFSGKGRLEQQQADEEQSAKPYVQKAMQGDQGAMAEVASRNPKTALVLEQALQRADARQRAHIKAASDFSAYGSNTVLQADPKDQPAQYARMLQEGRDAGFDMSKLPQVWDTTVPGILRFHRGQSKDINEMIFKRELEDRKDARKAMPGGVNQTGGLVDVGDGPVAPAAVAPPPVARPTGAPRVSELPPGVASPSMPPTQAAGVVPPTPPVQTAQVAPGTAQGSITADYQPTAQPSGGPLKPEAVTPGSPPIGGPQQPAPPKYQNRQIIYEDPATLGGVPQGRPQPNGSIKLEEGPGGTTLYRLPGQTKGQGVYYSPHLKAPLNENAVPSDVGDLHGDDFRAHPFYKGLPFPDRNDIEGMLTGEIPISTLAKRGGGGKGGVGGLPINTLMGIARQIDPTWSPNEGEQGKRFATSLVGNGQNALAVQAANVVPQHASDLVKITDALRQNNPQAVQGIINKLKEQFGDTAVPNMIAARNLSALEFLKAAVPGQLNQALEERFINSMNTAGTSAQMRSLVASYTDKVLGRAHYLQDLADNYGIKHPIITPRAQAAIDFLKAEPGSTVSGEQIPKQEPSTWDKAAKFFGGDKTQGAVPEPPAGFRIVK